MGRKSKSTRERELDEHSPNKLATQIPKAANWHFWPWCNFGCKFCFARFEDIARADTLPPEKALLVPEMLADAGVEKLTFVGGEPMLCPYLPDLLAKAKEVGLTTCMVTNATGLSDDFLDKNTGTLDWVGISIDASTDELHVKIGRAHRGDLSKGISHHLAEAVAAWDRCRKRGIRLKLNSVVTRHNANDDMTELVLRLKPARWKAFQVLSVDGQNDDEIDDLLVSDEAYQNWVQRHEKVRRHGITFIAESNDLMRGSYAMLDALGRFYDSAQGGHRYTAHSILQVGVDRAWEDVSFDQGKFSDRDGEYNWDQQPETK